MKVHTMYDSAGGLHQRLSDQGLSTSLVQHDRETLQCLLVVLQGFGNVGAYAAEIFSEHGGKVCWLYDMLDFEALIQPIVS